MQKENGNGTEEDLTEDVTKYGEYVCSQFHWLPIEKQKRRAGKMENISKKEENRR